MVPGFIRYRVSLEPVSANRESVHPTSCTWERRCPGGIVLIVADHTPQCAHTHKDFPRQFCSRVGRDTVFE